MDGGGKEAEWGILFLWWRSTPVTRDEIMWWEESVWFEATHGHHDGDVDALKSSEAYF